MTRAIRPAGALTFFAAMTLLGPFLAGTAVADTIGGVVDLSDVPPDQRALGIVAAGVAGAAIWNVRHLALALPSSSTHALVGGVVGVTVVVAGPGDVGWGFSALADGELEGVAKVLVALAVSPIVGVAAGFVVFRAGRRLLLRGGPRRQPSAPPPAGGRHGPAGLRPRGQRRPEVHGRDGPGARPERTALARSPSRPGWSWPRR